MYQLTFLICTFMFCISCSESAPPALLSALLSPSAAVSSSSSSSASQPNKHETGLTTYDQKQSGKYNIHLNIKDVAIIALDAGGVDGGVGDFGEDYYEDYDLSDFTVKPIYGLIDITSDKPTSTTSAPPLIHFEPEDLLTMNETSLNETENAPIVEPIIKDPVANDSQNKTQSVVILGENADASSTTNGIVVTTSTPPPENLPPKLTLADLASIQSSQKPTVLPVLFPTKPNEIPVQIILDSYPLQKQSSRQQPTGNWRLKNRIRAPASNHNRRITPPPEESSHYLASASSFGTGY